MPALPAGKAAAAPPAGTPTPGEAADAVLAHTADNKAASRAIAANTQLLTTVTAQEFTAHKNYELALSIADKLDRSGGNLLNRVVNDWNTGVTSDPETSAYVGALQVAHDEYAKVMSGATGAAGLTDAGRTAADSLFNKHMDLATLKAIQPVMDRDMGNRRLGYVKAIQAARAGIATPSSGGITGAAGNTVIPTDQGAPAANTAFATLAEAQAAEKAGTLQKGTKVTIGGQSGTWQ
jgi:hypothetical protein